MGLGITHNVTDRQLNRDTRSGDSRPQRLARPRKFVDLSPRALSVVLALAGALTASSLRAEELSPASAQAAPSPGAATTDATAQRPRTFTLANGLQVVVIEDHRTPVVTQMIWYKVGSADETPGKSGLAHFLEHLMFKGTVNHPAGEFSQTVIRVGGGENAFTSSDYTGYFQRVPRDQLARMMSFEADRMTGLTLKSEEVLPERDVVLEEYNMRVGNSPDARLTEQIMAALYLNHPYGRPVIGWRHEIEQLSRDDALAFYKRFYAPNNATLVIAGDVTADEVRPMAEQTFGPLPARPDIAAKRVRPQEPPPVAPRTVTLADPQVEQPALRRYYLVPSATTSAADSDALDVLAEVLGDGNNSLLNRSLVVDHPLAISASASYQGTAVDATQFVIAATPKPGVTFTQLEQAIDAVLAEITQNGVSAEMLERAKTQLVAETIYAQDNQATLARWYGAALTVGLTIDDVVSWPRRIRAVTADQVRDAARNWLDMKRSVTGYLVKATGRHAEKRS
ncbi:MAG: M16 family metallopeptidase [Xanthobacteraceae bacterium]